MRRSAGIKSGQESRQHQQGWPRATSLHVCQPGSAAARGHCKAHAAKAGHHVVSPRRHRPTWPGDSLQHHWCCGVLLDQSWGQGAQNVTRVRRCSNKEMQWYALQLASETTVGLVASSKTGVQSSEHAGGGICHLRRRLITPASFPCFDLCRQQATTARDKGTLFTATRLRPLTVSRHVRKQRRSSLFILL